MTPEITDKSQFYIVQTLEDVGYENDGYLRINQANTTPTDSSLERKREENYRRQVTTSQRTHKWH